MCDRVKREEVSTPSLLPELSFHTEESSFSVTLEDVVNSPGIIERIEQLDLLLLQISKTRQIEGRDLLEDAKLLRTLIRSDMTQIQVKVAELLDKYLKYGCTNVDSDALLKFYKMVHEDICVYLLPNVKAADFCTNFLCNLIATCSSKDTFLSIIKLFQKTVDGILGSRSGKELPSESARVVIGIMKTLLSVTKAFGSPPAPLNLLCKVSTSVIKSTNIHLCRLYSYNIIAFLLRDVTDDAVVASYTSGLSSPQVQHVTALIKESTSWNDVCNWKFKYQEVPTQSDAGSVNIEFIDDPPFTESDFEFSQMSTDAHVQSSQSCKSRAGKQQTPTANDSTCENWIKALSTKFDKKRGNDGKPVVVDKNAWKGKLEVLEKAIKEVETSALPLHISSHSQLLSVMENIFKFESAIPVVINGLMLFTLVMRRSEPDIVSVTKSQGLADLVFDKLKENNKKVRDAAIFAVEEIIMKCKPVIIVESFKRALTHKSPSCRETACNIINGRGVNIGNDERLVAKLTECSEGLKPLVAELANDKMVKVKSASALASKVLDDFELFSKNVPKVAKNVIDPSTLTHSGRHTGRDVTKRRINTVPATGPKRRNFAASQQDMEPTPPVMSQSDVTAQPLTHHATQVALQTAPSPQPPAESVPRQDPPINKIGIETVEKIKRGAADKGAVLEGLCSLCMWINQHPEDAKEMDSLLLQFVGQHTNGYKLALGDGNVTLSLFFQHLIGLDLSMKGFEYLLDLLVCTVDLNPNFIFSAILCSHNQSVANKLFCPPDLSLPDHSHTMDRHVATLELLKNHSLVNLIIGEPVLAKMLNYCAYFASQSVEPCKKLSTAILSNLEKRTSPEHVSRLMDHKYHKVLKSTGVVPISKSLKLAHVEAGLELEKSISKDLYLCMFQEGNLENRKRSCLFWKVFVQKRNDRTESMLFGEGNILGGLIIWLCHTLFEEKVDKVVLEILACIIGLLEDKDAILAQNESFILVESLHLYNGKYKRRCTDLIPRVMARCTVSVPLLECIFKVFESGDLQENFREIILNVVKSCKTNSVITCYILLKLESFADKNVSQLVSDVTSIVNPLGTSTGGCVDEHDDRNASAWNVNVMHKHGVNMRGEQREPGCRDENGRAPMVVMDSPQNGPLWSDHNGESIMTIGAPERPECVRMDDVMNGGSMDGQNEQDEHCGMGAHYDDHNEPTIEHSSHHSSLHENTFQSPLPRVVHSPNGSNVDKESASSPSRLVLDDLEPDQATRVAAEATTEQAAPACNSPISESSQFFAQEEQTESPSVDPEISSLEITECSVSPKELQGVPTETSSIAEVNVEHKSELSVEKRLSTEFIPDVSVDALLTERVATEDQSMIPVQEEIGSLEATPVQDSGKLCALETLEDMETLEECTPQASGVPLECTITESIETCQRLSREIIRHSLPPRDAKLVEERAETFEEHDPMEQTQAGSLESSDERWNTLETILSHCSAITNSCLASSFKECLLPGVGEPKNVCTVHGLKILDLLREKDFIAKTLAPVLVDVCHSSIVSLCKSIDRLVASEDLSKSFSTVDENVDGLSDIIRAIVIILEIFQLVTSPTSLKNNLLLPFCNVIIQCLALPKFCFYNEELYGLLSRLISVNALQQGPETIYKCLLIMIELDIETLERVDFGRMLLAKLRFTRILQMQMLLNLEHSRPTMRSHVDYNVLKQRHVVFVRKLEEFVVARPLYGINGKLDKVLQCSNVLLRTIEMP